MTLPDHYLVTHNGWTSPQNFEVKATFGSGQRCLKIAVPFSLSRLSFRELHQVIHFFIVLQLKISLLQWSAISARLVLREREGLRSPNSLRPTTSLRLNGFCPLGHSELRHMRWMARRRGAQTRWWLARLNQAAHTYTCR
jgi:hypothetical protein